MIAKTQQDFLARVSKERSIQHQLKLEKQQRKPDESSEKKVMHNANSKSLNIPARGQIYFAAVRPPTANELKYQNKKRLDEKLDKIVDNYHNTLRQSEDATSRLISIQKPKGGASEVSAEASTLLESICRARERERTSRVWRVNDPLRSQR